MAGIFEGVDLGGEGWRVVDADGGRKLFHEQCGTEVQEVGEMA